MTTAPPSFADLALGLRVEAAWSWTAWASAASFAARRPELGVAVWSPPGGGVAFATYYGPGSPLSQAGGLGLDGGPVLETVLDSLEAFYDELDNPTSIEVSTLTDPSFLPALSARGYRIGEATHMLVRPLPATGLEPAPAAVRVERVDPADAETLAACHEVVLRGFFEGPGDPPAEIAAVMEAMTAAPGTTLWLARTSDAGTPAAGASLIVRDGLALFAGDATPPPFRRLGGQSALIRARLGAAADLGCDLAVVCTAPGSPSQRNYERLGFRLIYARVLMVREPKK